MRKQEPEAVQNESPHGVSGYVAEPRVRTLKGALRSAGCLASTCPTSRPGAHRAPRDRLVAGRRFHVGVHRKGMPATGWIQVRPGCRRVHCDAAPARLVRSATGRCSGGEDRSAHARISYGRRPETANTISTPSTGAAVADGHGNTLLPPVVLRRPCGGRSGASCSEPSGATAPPTIKSGGPNQRSHFPGAGPGRPTGAPSGMSNLNCARERSSAFVRVTVAIIASVSV